MDKKHTLEHYRAQARIAELEGALRGLLAWAKFFHPDCEDYAAIENAKNALKGGAR